MPRCGRRRMARTWTRAEAAVRRSSPRMRTAWHRPQRRGLACRAGMTRQERRNAAWAASVASALARPHGRRSSQHRAVSPAAGVQSLAQAANVGELFQYVIATPVTLPRQESAMLPIVNDVGQRRKTFDLQPAGAGQASAQRPAAHQHHRPAPDARPDHGLRRRRLCRRRPDRRHAARRRAADQLCPRPGHRSGARDESAVPTRSPACG